MIQKLKFETWNGRRAIVLRTEEGKLITWRYQKGSGIKSKQIAKKVYTKNGTFHRDRVKRKLTNVTYHEVNAAPRIEGGRSIKPKSPNKKDQQYFVRGTIKHNGKSILIVGWSLTLGSPLCETKDKCRQYAWNNFWKRLGGMGNSGDADVGKGLADNVKDYDFGWAYFT